MNIRAYDIDCLWLLLIAGIQVGHDYNGNGGICGDIWDNGGNLIYCGFRTRYYSHGSYHRYVFAPLFQDLSGPIGLPPGGFLCLSQPIPLDRLRFRHQSQQHEQLLTYYFKVSAVFVSFFMKYLRMINDRQLSWII